MAIQFSGRVAKDNSLRFTLELPGIDQELEIDGELAWGGNGAQAGVRFKDTTDEQRNIIRQWLSGHLPEPEQDDPPMSCRLSDLSLGGCYLTTGSPFPRGTRVVLLVYTALLEVVTGAVVVVAHQQLEVGRGVQASTE